MKLSQQAQLDAILDQAHMASLGQRPQEALKLLAQVLHSQPGNVDARLLLAGTLIELHRGDDALSALDAAAQYDTDDADRLNIAVLRAKALIVVHRDADAHALLKTLLVKCPQDVQLLRLTALTCQRLDLADEEMKCYERLIELDPHDLHTRRALARLISNDNASLSISMFRSSAEAVSPAQRWQSTQWMKQNGQHRDAEENYLAMLQVSEDDASLWMEAGEHAHRSGAAATAIIRYERALDLDGPHQVDARKSLGRVLMQAGRFEEAIWHWWKAARSDNNDEEALAGLTTSALCAQRPRLAELAQKRLEALGNDDEILLLMTDMWLHASGGQVIRTATQDAQPLRITGSPLEWILHHSAEALHEHATAHKGWADTLYHTAVCEAALGEHEAAREHVQDALDINPNYKAATTLAARLPKAA